MSEIALAKINNFAHVAQQADVSPEEPIFVLTGSQLQEIISRAIAEATEPLKAEIQELRDVERQDMRTLSHDIQDAFESIDEIDTKNNHKVPGKTEISRAEKIEKYLQARPDHRATFETLKGCLGVDKNRLKEAIRTLMESSPGRYGITRAPGDKRKRTLVMLPR